MTTKEVSSEYQLRSTERVLLNEVVDWSGRFLTAYAHLLEAERNRNEDDYAQAWGDMMTALFLLRDKTEQAHEMLDR